MKKLRGLIYLFIGGAAISMTGCKSSKSYEAKYDAAWQEVLASDAWKESLEQPQTGDDDIAVTSDDDLWLTDENSSRLVSDPFWEQYDSWIRRAYFMIITEAEKADSRIKSEYERFLAENPEAAESRDENVMRIMALYKKKYRAHETMLTGLKSWHAFEEYGSDDLKFFKQENEKVVRSMYRTGEKEKHIVDYLVYKLADLYHLDGNSKE